MKTKLTALVLFFAFFSGTAEAQLFDLIKKKVKDIDEARPKELSPLNKKYVNKIVFTSNIEAIDKDAEKESEFADNFVLGSLIYFRVYLDKPLLQYMKKLLPDVDKGILATHSRYRIKFLLDGVDVYSAMHSEGYFDREGKETWTTFRGGLTTREDLRELIGQSNFYEFISEQESKLTPGDHKLTMQIIPCTEYPRKAEGPVVASGEITLTVKNSAIDPNDPQVCLPKANMNDEALEAKILKAFKSKGWSEQPKTVRILSTKWDVQRNKYTSVVERRTVEAVVASVRNGKCISQTFSFAQDFDGVEYQKEVYLYGTGPQRDLNCKCIP